MSDTLVLLNADGKFTPVLIRQRDKSPFAAFLLVFNFTLVFFWLIVSLLCGTRHRAIAVLAGAICHACSIHRPLCFTASLPHFLTFSMYGRQIRGADVLVCASLQYLRVWLFTSDNALSCKKKIKSACKNRQNKLIIFLANLYAWDMYTAVGTRWALSGMLRLQ